MAPVAARNAPAGKSGRERLKPPSSRKLSPPFPISQFTQLKLPTLSRSPAASPQRRHGPPAQGDGAHLRDHRLEAAAVRASRRRRANNPRRPVGTLSAGADRRAVSSVKEETSCPPKPLSSLTVSRAAPRLCAVIISPTVTA